MLDPQENKNVLHVHFYENEICKILQISDFVHAAVEIGRVFVSTLRLTFSELFTLF